MIKNGLTWLVDQLFAGVDERENAEGRFHYKRLALPHSFKPQLSFREAIVSATATFLRILIGSTLFAFWGAYSLHTLTTRHSYFQRAALLLLYFCLFVIAFLLLLASTAAMVRAALGQRPASLRTPE